MTTFFAAVSVIAGVFMIASMSRGRFPCFLGGCAAILTGVFTLALPYLDAVQPIGWLWFCIWIASLPALVACVVSLIILTTKDRKLLAVTVFGVIAMLSNVSPTLAFIDAAASGVVDAGDKTNANRVGDGF
ncbi:hypothetical protein [Roseibacillus ishigakijimensis]|uniref:Uncharacterized protein n=1 Tax=Roseibacillus ishigakijimensis TaxID=454146 RepID=A0A934RQ70_9BACT|nr:hypothetical protein [Roseibacillus ishigakijimensis]MBK1834923.1 hypothetical protein [Roseibacillus ishigakijimensis]